MSLYKRAIIFLSLLCVGVFVLPFYIPAHTKTVSPSYDYHFNNTISVISLWLSLLLFLILFYKESKAAIAYFSVDDWLKHSATAGLGRRHFFIALILYALVIFFLYYIGANYRYAEGDYFLDRIDRLGLHQTPYKDFEYAYGIVFIYLPFWINRLFGFSSSVPGYCISLILFDAIGLYLLYRLVDVFNIDRKKKLVIFYGIVLCFIPYQNGLNYSVIRYMMPIAGIFWLVMYGDRAAPENLSKSIYFALIAAALTVFIFSISIEMGFSFFVSVLGYLAFSVYRKKSSSYFFTICFILILLAAFYFIFGGQSVFLTMKSFSSGTMNWVVIPSLSICLYIISLTLIIFLFSAKLFEGKKNALACFIVFNLLMIAPAFGRCDPGHILNNGLITFISAWALVAYLNKKYFTIYSALFFIVFVFAMNFSSLLSYKENLGIAIIKKFKDNPSAVKIITRIASSLDKEEAGQIDDFMQKEQSVTDTLALDQYPRVALPFYVDKDIYLYLLKKGTYAPGFYTDLLNVGTEQQINEKLSILKNEDHIYMVIPEKYFDQARIYSISEKEEKEYISWLFLYPFTYQKITDSRNMLEPIYKYIIDNYDQVKVVKKGYILVKRKMALAYTD